MGIHRRILRLAAAALLAVPGFAYAQGRQISGTVTRSSGGAPVGEATVSITGTTNSARTDAQGKFTISAPLVDVRLTVRAIGFSRKDVMVSAATTTVQIGIDDTLATFTERMHATEHQLVVATLARVCGATPAPKEIHA